MAWIDKLVSMHKELESPQSFWFWAGLAAMSATVKDNVWMERHAYKLYPNIYVMLHADSGLKKGPPVALAKDLVSRVNNTEIISGRSSIQGILKQLGTAESVKGGGIKTKSTGFICASEFSSSLVSDPVAMTILTDLYDRNYNEGEWRSLLKMETFKLHNPTLSLLVATNEAHFEDFVQAKDIHGGFIGRMFVIAETEVNVLNPLIRKPKVVPNREELASYLREVAQLRGAFESLEDTKAGLIYEEWYTDFYTIVKKNKVKDETGTINRFGDSVLKVAMLLSLSENTSLIISTEAMERAINICERFITDVRRTTMGKRSKAENIELKLLLLNEFLARPDNTVSRTILMKKFYLNYRDVAELDSVLESLEEADAIVRFQHGNQLMFQMKEQYVNEIAEFMKGRQ